VGHIACIAENRKAYKVLVGKPEGKRSGEDLGIDGNILKWILNK
jgi:hypothetical protein